ncbi:MAG: hypothetical protein IPL98_01810 [Saprospiraceae bacterium]|nr:hypothetical protein [Saprospiraceae bacterium]
MCSLSKIFASLGDKLTALGYLNLATQNIYQAMAVCENGMIMYKTKLSLDFADYYLLTGELQKRLTD